MCVYTAGTKRKKGGRGFRRRRYKETQNHNRLQESLITQEKNIASASKVLIERQFDNNNDDGQDWKGGYAIYAEQRECGI